MIGSFFEPSSYYDAKLRRRDRKNGISQHPSRSNKGGKKHRSKRDHISTAREAPSALYRSKSSETTSPTLSTRTLPTSRTPGVDMYSSHHHHKYKRSKRRPSTPSSASKSSSNLRADISAEDPPEDIFAAYQRKLKKKKRHRSAKMSSKGAQTLLGIEKDRITKDKFSRLFHDFEATKSYIHKLDGDQLFRRKLKEFNIEKHKNKAAAYELIQQHFTVILDKKQSKHPLARLITKFSNLFHAQYSLSPEDFKNKSNLQMSVDMVCDDIYIYTHSATERDNVDEYGCGQSI